MYQWDPVPMDVKLNEIHCAIGQTRKYPGPDYFSGFGMKVTRLLNLPRIERHLPNVNLTAAPTPACSNAMSVPPLTLPPAPPTLPLNPPLTSNRSPLTLEQLLKAVIVPPPPKEFSTTGNTTDDEEPIPHTSSRHNHHHGGIKDAALRMFTRKKVRTFCDIVTALSEFVMCQNDMKQPFNGSTITNEGDVTAYLECQVIIPTWEAVTRMFPASGRTYDLMSKRQFYMKVMRSILVPINSCHLNMF